MRTHLLSACFSLLFIAAGAALAQTLPDGPGSAILTNACQNCHGLDVITSVHHDAEGWRSTVLDMIGRGAEVSDDDQQTVIAYLTAHYGPAGAATPAAVPPPPAQ